MSEPHESDPLSQQLRELAYATGQDTRDAAQEWYDEQIAAVEGLSGMAGIPEVRNRVLFGEALKTIISTLLLGMRTGILKRQLLATRGQTEAFLAAAALSAADGHREFGSACYDASLRGYTEGDSSNLYSDARVVFEHMSGGEREFALEHAIAIQFPVLMITGHVVAGIAFDDAPTVEAAAKATKKYAKQLGKHGSKAPQGAHEDKPKVGSRARTAVAFTLAFLDAPAWPVLGVFVFLKSFGTLSWSWWWVTSPLWIALGFAASVGLVVFLVELWMFWASRW